MIHTQQGRQREIQDITAYKGHTRIVQILLDAGCATFICTERTGSAKSAAYGFLGLLQLVVALALEDLDRLRAVAPDVALDSGAGLQERPSYAHEKEGA